MSIWVTLEMQLRPGAMAELEPFLKANLPAVRGFDGALLVQLYFNPETGRFMLLEEWVSREHHQAYIAAITENGVMEQLLSFMAGPPDVQYFERMPL
ncbi:Antibiotic biosynthesis monooxygenase [Pelagimonas phthalicica]|uniref:Antibiotic biosynthesis monooxygenase n=1 Tax=Pelagimonas phthalicica TaxID=1037362 RepID=A0A238J9L4_9RHOB|nr:antibiotic biosynthesis monooxygenase [Pelagimonas phthalicica]TDS94408.1 quinol monooxygenase YgiN [Pelagimonas phthalicica]SMX27065.1 Antibiotic biosynthesis monooxygenase [Pelagimonas phthalicica]